MPGRGDGAGSRSLPLSTNTLTGVLDVPVERVVRKGRLQPGRMLLIDTAAGCIVDDEELKHTIATERPYGEWLEKHLVNLEEAPLSWEGIRVANDEKTTGSSPR